MGKKVTRTTTKKRKVIVEPFGNVYIKATFNNVIVSITNTYGHVIAWSSAGKMGFKGSKKNTPYAAQKAAEDCAKIAFDLGMRKATVFIKGPGAGRDAAVRVINNIGIEVTSITDTTPIPHNGCRPPKRRRV
jgi:small subunit ribosomal protein S11